MTITAPIFTKTVFAHEAINDPDHGTHNWMDDLGKIPNSAQVAYWLQTTFVSSRSRTSPHCHSLADETSLALADCLHSGLLT
jgi:hypothetical protein